MEENKEVKVMEVSNSLMKCLRLRVEVEGVMYSGWLIAE